MHGAQFTWICIARMLEPSRDRCKSLSIHGGICRDMHARRTDTWCQVVFRRAFLVSNNARRWYRWTWTRALRAEGVRQAFFPRDASSASNRKEVSLGISRIIPNPTPGVPYRGSAITVPTPAWSYFAPKTRLNSENANSPVQCPAATRSNFHLSRKRVTMLLTSASVTSTR